MNKYNYRKTILLYKILNINLDELINIIMEEQFYFIKI